MLYKQNEKEIFKKVKEKCNDDLQMWNLVNLGFPLCTFLLSLFIFSYSSKSSEIENYYGIILGGVLPLVAINLVVAGSFFLIKFDKVKEQQFGLQTSNTRLKLIIYSSFSYLFSSSLFVTQTIYAPFGTCLQRLIQFATTALAIYFALNVSNKLFLLQEDMLVKSYDEDISSKVASLKSAIQ